MNVWERDEVVAKANTLSIQSGLRETIAGAALSCNTFLIWKKHLGDSNKHALDMHTDYISRLLRLWEP